MVERESHIGDKISKGKCRYIRRLETNAERFAHMARSRWGIENSLHYAVALPKPPSAKT